MTSRSRVIAAARSGERGFTLAETAIALLIMMIASVGIVSLFTYSIQYNEGAKDRELAMAVAQKRLESLRAIPYDSTTRAVAYTAGGLAATGSSGVTQTTTSAGRSYTVVTTITNFPSGATDANSKVKTIKIKVTPDAAKNALGEVTLITQRSILLMGTN
jgi:Tfp pilus assembly protein PilV